MIVHDDEFWRVPICVKLSFGIKISLQPLPVNSQFGTQNFSKPVNMRGHLQHTVCIIKSIHWRRKWNVWGE